MNVIELNDFMYNHGFCNTDNDEDLPKKYVADLVEAALKEGYDKAIDEFVNLVNECSGYTENCVEHDLCLTVYTIHQIAEQMKGSEADG